MKNGLLTMLLATALVVPAAAVSSAEYWSMSTEKVQAIQQVLADEGYYRAGVDGQWGPKTSAGLREFQRDNGLMATGRLNQATVDELGVQVSEADRIGPARSDDSYMVSTMNNDTESSDDGFLGLGNLFGMNDDRQAERLNQDVTPAAGTSTMIYRRVEMIPPTRQYLDKTATQALQQTLREAGYHTKEPVTGIWGPYTSTALMSYQVDEGLPGTGVPDEETLTKLGLMLQASDQIPAPENP